MPPCKDLASKRAETLRKLSSSLSADDLQNAPSMMIDRTRGMASRAKERSPLTNEELDDVVNSLHNITPQDTAIDWIALRCLLAEVAHLSHKDWSVTGNNSGRLASIILGSNADETRKGEGSRESGRLTAGSHEAQMLERILHEGNWGGAASHAQRTRESNPWAVLVTGVNGIRKTTAIYQPWFAEVLQEALIPPEANESSEIKLDDLPCGDNSFFRQLDHMITTLCNEDFALLYELTAAQLGNKKAKSDSGESVLSAQPDAELVRRYSSLKASIFSRYRTLSELLGVLLLREAQKSAINVMCETSGRDVAMFHYIDHFFGSSEYNKLALHFTINDLSHAKKSVDARMVDEMLVGQRALQSGDVLEVIYANAGGPYGSEVLEGVQADSDRVWNDEVMNSGGKGGVGDDWYKAEFRINAHDDKPWTIQAVRKDGSLGAKYEFGDPRTV